MAKFKIGDKVEILDGSKIPNYTGGFISDMHDYVGRTATIESIGDGCFGGTYYRMKEFSYSWDERSLKLVTDNDKKIVITNDGKTTLARLYDGKNVVKTAEAKCSPEDRFDFNLGATIALSRLTGFEKKVEKSEAGEKPSFKKGDRVKITGNKSHHGFKIGSIVTIINDHATAKNAWKCEGIDKYNHNDCWWVRESDMVKVDGLDWEAFKAAKIAVKVTKDNFKGFVAMAKMQGLRFKPDADFNPFEHAADIFFRVTLPVTLKRDELYIVYKDNRLKAAYDCDDMEEFAWA